MSEPTSITPPASSQPASAVPPTPAPAPIPPRGVVSTLIRRFFAFIGWILTGFGLLGAFTKSRSSHADDVVVYTVHPSFYLWALIAVGFVAAPCVKHWPGTASTWGWIYVFAVLYTIVTLLFDVNTMKALLWGGIFLLLWIASKYLEDLRHMTVLSGVWNYLASLKPELNPGMASVISWLLLVPWIGTLFHSFCHGRKAFSPNTIEERFFGEGREITDRNGLKFRTKYRDLFETFLGLGAGDLEAVDANHHVVKRWDNILFLCFIWPRLDQILHQRSAVMESEDPQKAQ